MTNVQLLEQVGRALYGERWQTAIAADLNLTSRAIRNYVAGERTCPDLRIQLLDLVAGRQGELDKLAGAITKSLKGK